MLYDGLVVVKVAHPYQRARVLRRLRSCCSSTTVSVEHSYQTTRWFHNVPCACFGFYTNTLTDIARISRLVYFMDRRATNVFANRFLTELVCDARKETQSTLSNDFEQHPNAVSMHMADEWRLVYDEMFKKHIKAICTFPLRRLRPDSVRFADT